MPFVSNMQDETEERKNQAPGPQSSQGPISPNARGGAVRLAPSGAVPAGRVSSGSGAMAAGGQFAGLGQYLKANTGNAESLAGKLTSGIGQQYNTLQGQNESVINDINRQIAANAAPSNANDILARETDNPISFASNPSNISSFQNLLNAAYAGPASAEGTSGYTNQQNAINSAIAAGESSTKTEAGRANLLRSNEAEPTTGVTALNSSILSQNPNALKSVETAYQPFSNLLSSLNQGAQTANASIAKNKTALEQANSKANQAISGQTEKFQNTIQGKLSDAQKAANNYNAGLQQWQIGTAANQPLNAALQQSKLLSALGITDPFTANYATMNAPTANTVATADDLAMQQALNNLGNQNLSLINPIDSIGGYQSPSTVPQAINIPGLLNQMTGAAIKNYVGGNGVKSLPIQPGLFGSKTLGGAQSAALQGFAPNQFTNYDTQVAPFQKLMTALNSIYGDKYVTPALYNGKPIVGGPYILNT